MERKLLVNMREDYPVWAGWNTERLIGRGSFGAVYEISRDFYGMKECAALKVISIPQTEGEIDELRSDGLDDESIRSTFTDQLQSIVQEYSMMRKLNGNTNVVNCDDVVVTDHEDGFGKTILIKMELLTPMTKTDFSGDAEETAVQLGIAMCNALNLCESENIIHRDIKPANIFLSDKGAFKLGDFGVSRTMERTTGGTKTGTPDYMAPEVYFGRKYNHTVDIYSLGIVMYWLLNNRRTPFLPQPPAVPKLSDKDSARERRFSGEPIPAPINGSEELKRIVLKACSYDPKNRYASAAEMRADLLALKDTPAEEPHTSSESYRTNVNSNPKPDSTGNQPEDADETVGVWNRPVGAAEKQTEAQKSIEEQESAEEETIGVWHTPPADSKFQFSVETVDESDDDKTMGVFGEQQNAPKTDGALIVKNKSKKRKKTIAFIASIVLVILLVVVIRSRLKFNNAMSLLSKANVGDTVFFGSYEQDNNTSNGTEDIEWIILDVEVDKALIVSKYALSNGVFCEDGNAAKWESSLIRSWLNTDFIGEAFTAMERQKILPTKTEDNTIDSLFILSESETLKYMDDVEIRATSATPYAVSTGAVKNSQNGNTAWWERSPIREDGSPPTIARDGVYCHGDTQSYYIAIRPAMWISLDY